MKTRTPNPHAVQLAGFIQEILRRRWVTDIKGTLGKALAEHLNNTGQRADRRRKNNATKSDRFEPADFRNLGNPDPNRLGLGRRHLRLTIQALQKIHVYGQPQGALKELYEVCFPDFPFQDEDALSGQGLFRHDTQIGRIDHSVLHGDYGFFRVESRKPDRPGALAVGRDSLVSFNFVRFYVHDHSGVRFMMLSMRSAETFQAAKGWVDTLGRSHLCSGRIVSRLGDTRAEERRIGGMSTLVVQTWRDAPLTVYRMCKCGDITIEAAPALHLRAVYGNMPSLSRGYVIRLRDTSTLGGTETDTEEQRYHAIKSLQSRLKQSDFGTDMNIKTCGQRLSMTTGFDLKYFYDPTAKHGARGILYNLPFRADSLDDNEGFDLALPTTKYPFWADPRYFEKELPKESGSRVVGDKFGIPVDLTPRDE